jgi:tRNA(Arg) A34 adenosine deaminase TadA
MGLDFMQDEKSEEFDLMQKTIDLSRDVLAKRRGAYCATIIVKDGEIVGQGWNNVAIDNDPTGHCEINAMRVAGQTLGTWNLSGCDLYTTWEPCPMCVAAIAWARVSRVFYANRLADAEDLGIDIESIWNEVRVPMADRGRPYERLMGEEALAVVTEWWQTAKPELI